MATAPIFGRPLDRERDVDRPVVPPLAIFAGAVERIDDPHPVARQPLRLVGAFLGQDRIFGPPFAQGWSG